MSGPKVLWRRAALPLMRSRAEREGQRAGTTQRRREQYRQRDCQEWGWKVMRRVRECAADRAGVGIVDTWRRPGRRLGAIVSLHLDA